MPSDAGDAGGDVTIVSSDKDLMQLVQPGVVMLDTMKNKTHRPRRGAREVRRAARQGRRRAGAGRRLDRQRAGRAGHRRQDGGRADQRVRRPRHAAGARRRDQAAQAPREADRVRRRRRASRASWCALKDDVPVEVPIEQLGVREPEPATLLGFLREMEFSTLTQAHRRGAGRRAAAAARASPSARQPCRRQARRARRAAKAGGKPRRGGIADAAGRRRS